MDEDEKVIISMKQLVFIVALVVVMGVVLLLN